MDNTLKQLFPKNSITVLKKKEQTCKNFSQEPILTTSKVFYQPEILMAIKNVAKILLM